MLKNQSRGFQEATCLGPRKQGLTSIKHPKYTYKGYDTELAYEKPIPVGGHIPFYSSSIQSGLGI
jgi:hypothetical protein